MLSIIGYILFIIFGIIWASGALPIVLTFFGVIYLIGLVIYNIYKNIQKNIKDKKEAIVKASEIIANAERKAADIMSKATDYQTQKIDEIERLAALKCEAFPYMAVVTSDFLTIHYEKSAELLEKKTRPAYVEAKRIRELRAETKDLLKDKKELEYKLAYIKELFPNVEDIFDEGFNEEADFILETDDNTDRTRLFLSHEEYTSLTTAEKNQLALDRYVESRKSKWQIGRDYEMYIGQAFENKGFKVEYTGIIENLEDMGRDLIAKKQNKTYIVQCKNWSQEKIIHEKHIFQLYGTVILKTLEDPDAKVRGIFVTSTALSDKAKAIAQHLNIWVYQKIPLKPFARIKCNINRTNGEKIYHLPFDQQYDRTVVDKEKGEFYALTVNEAEAAGYRRAWRHYENI